MKAEGVSRGFEERVCARSSRRTPGTMQRAGQGAPQRGRLRENKSPAEAGH